MVYCFFNDCKPGNGIEPRFSVSKLKPFLHFTEQSLLYSVLAYSSLVCGAVGRGLCLHFAIYPEGLQADRLVFSLTPCRYCFSLCICIFCCAFVASLVAQLVNLASAEYTKQLY